MNEQDTLDSCLRTALAPRAEERLARFDRGEPRRFSRRYERKKARLFRDAARGSVPVVRKRRAYKTVFAVVAAAVFLSVTAISAGPLREAIVKAEVDINEERVRIEYQPGFIRNGESEMAVPTYIPAGYALSEKLDGEEFNAQFYDAIYECKGVYVPSGKHYKWVPSGWFEVRCYKLDEEDGVTFYGIQNEGEIYSIRVGEYEGHVQYLQGAPDAIKYTFLMWSDGIYFYSIRSTLDIVEVLRIAENMK